jgi:antirestriction protein ArdC
MNRSEIQEQVTNLIIKELEAGNVPWHKGWSTAGFMPSNIVSGKAYSGINALILSIIGSQYGSPLWLTFKQAQGLGGSVKKGEKGTHITYYSKIAKKDKETGELESSFAMLKTYVVFNVEQCEGVEIPEKFKVERDPVAVLEGIERILATYPNRPEIYYQEQGRAYYSPSADTITLPSLAQFESEFEHAQTITHELTHSTGHTSRLNRWEGAKSMEFGCEDYASEELIAELGSVMLLSEVGVPVNIPNSGAYIKGWLKALKNDKSLVFTAAGKASKAVTLMMGEVKEEVMA